LIEADSITTSDLTTNTLTATSFKTNLVQSINAGNSLTLEALTTGQVLIRSNGTNIAVFDSAKPRDRLIRDIEALLPDNVTRKQIILSYRRKMNIKKSYQNFNVEELKDLLSYC
jgi:hypothetical protein